MKEKTQIKGNAVGILFWGLAIFWMAFIFYMSAQNGEESAGMSSPVTDFVIRIVVPDFEDKTPAEQEDIKHTVEFIIRKGAHFTEYAVLGFLVYLVVQMYILKTKARFIVSWMFSILYAVSDEIHQGFVGGRAPLVKDVCIDSAGAFAGVLVSVLVIWMLVKKRSRKMQYSK